jgi:hypothetical protein
MLIMLAVIFLLAMGAAAEPIRPFVFGVMLLAIAWKLGTMRAK